MKTQNISQAFPLAMVSEGDWVKIDRVVGGKNLFKRLITMGLIEETELQVLQR
ncbi:MAG: ferrous iron transport protein A [Pseudomonadota bacterium]